MIPTRSIGSGIAVIRANPLPAVWNKLLAYAGAVPIRSKIMGIVLGLVVILGLGITFQVRLTLESTLTEELHLRGESIANDLAARGVDYLLTNNAFALHNLVGETLTNNPDVRYVFVLDPNGQVRAHTFGDSFPRDLLAVHTTPAGNGSQTVLLESEEGLLLDVAAPIFRGRAGVARVGLSQQRMQTAIQTVTTQLLLATAFVSLVGVVAAYLLTLLLTHPVLDLVRVTRAIEAGDVGRRAHVWASDEIGQLGHALNAMVTRLEAMQRDLLRRNGELEARNAVAEAVSSTLVLDDVLNRAIEVVLDTTEFDACGILLSDPEREGLVYRAHQGFSAVFVEAVSGLRVGEGVAGQVVETGEPIAIADLATDPRVTRPAVQAEGFHAFVSVPLRAGDGVVGTLNVASRRFLSVDATTQQLLVAIGAEIGVAVQNARLWQELKQKEALRGYLLQRVISAQEEERRRIARELHDETSQALTTVMVGLRLLAQEHPDARATARADELRNVVGNALDAIHDLLFELRPSMLDDIGLPAALQRYSREYGRKHGLVVDFQVGGLDHEHLPSQIEIAAYRIVQEALTNVARHAGAQNVSLLLERRGDRLIAVVEDDGRGFDPSVIERAAEGERSLGLAGMRERAELLGGTLSIESQPAAGTAVFVDLPLAQTAVGVSA